MAVGVMIAAIAASPSPSPSPAAGGSDSGDLLSLLALVVSVISLVTTTAIGYLQFRTQARLTAIEEARRSDEISAQKSEEQRAASARVTARWQRTPPALILRNHGPAPAASVQADVSSAVAGHPPPGLASAAQAQLPLASLGPGESCTLSLTEPYGMAATVSVDVRWNDGGGPHHETWTLSAGDEGLRLRGVEQRAEWDVAVVGGGPAGMAAARAAASAGARTVVLERAEHPRYKTCGGGLMGASLTAVADLDRLPSRDSITAATFTLHGGRRYTRRHAKPILAMVLRDEFDDALRRRAEAAGAVVRPRTAVRGIEADAGTGTGTGGQVTVRLADGGTVTAAVVIGADGSAGVTTRHVGVEFDQVDLGLEQEIDVPDSVADQWRGRILLDWGTYPGSYGWVFPKASRLTVGVIASRGQGEWTKRYMTEFIARLGLDSFPVGRDSGHLTRCRADGAPLRKGRVLVTGDAAGLLEPWTREGISFALRSGAFAGEAAAKGASAESSEAAGSALDEYVANVNRVLVPEMAAGRLFLTAFSRHTGVFHTGLATPKGQRMFGQICRSEITYPEIAAKPGARRALKLLSR